MTVIAASEKYKEFYEGKYMSPLQGAISAGQNNICKVLIVKEGVALKYKSPYPQPLWMAYQLKNYEIADLLIEYGADVNIPAEDDFPLALALYNNCNVSIVRRIIEAGFPVDGIVHCPSKRTALHVAVNTNNYPIAKYLLQDASADPNVKDHEGLTPLHVAACKNIPAMVELLVENGASLDSKCIQYCTPMFYAMALDHHDMVGLLISLGSNVDAEIGIKKFPPLHYASSYSDLKFVMLLIEKGADVNKEMPETGETPLHCAAHGKIENNRKNEIALNCIVELLIKHNADINKRDRNSLTPFLTAIISKNFSVAKRLAIGLNGSVENDFLVEGDYTNLLPTATVRLDKKLIQDCFDNGADWNVTDEHGLHPLHLALESFMSKVITGETQTTAINDLLEIFKMFWRQGFPYDKSLKLKLLETGNFTLDLYLQKIETLVENQNVLFGGLKKLQVSVVQRAIEYGAEAKCCSTSMPYPLHFLAYKGNYQIMKLLLKQGMKVNYLDDKGQSALYIAAMKGHTTCCQLLLEYGASYNHTNPKNLKTPLEVARTNGKKKIVKMLTIVDTFFKNIKKDHLLELANHQEMLRGILFCCNRRGLTLLQLALERGNKSSASLLTKIKMNIEII